MATIIGGIGSSHAPTIGVAYDRGQQNDPNWAPLFAGYEPARAWLDEIKPDLFLIVYNDHANSFFFDKWPTLALGVGATHPQATRGGASARSATFRAIRNSAGTSRVPWWSKNSILPFARKWRSTMACCPSCRC